MTQNHKP